MWFPPSAFVRSFSCLYLMLFRIVGLGVHSISARSLPDFIARCENSQVSKHKDAGWNKKYKHHILLYFLFQSKSLYLHSTENFKNVHRSSYAIFPEIEMQLRRLAARVELLESRRSWLQLMAPRRIVGDNSAVRRGNPQAVAGVRGGVART